MKVLAAEHGYNVSMLIGQCVVCKKEHTCKPHLDLTPDEIYLAKEADANNSKEEDKHPITCCLCRLLENQDNIKNQTSLPLTECLLVKNPTHVSKIINSPTTLVNLVFMGHSFFHVQATCVYACMLMYKCSPVWQTFVYAWHILCSHVNQFQCLCIVLERMRSVAGNKTALRANDSSVQPATLKNKVFL